MRNPDNDVALSESDFTLPNHAGFSSFLPDFNKVEIAITVNLSVCAFTKMPQHLCKQQDRIPGLLGPLSLSIQGLGWVGCILFLYLFLLYWLSICIVYHVTRLPSEDTARVTAVDFLVSLQKEISCYKGLTKSIETGGKKP